MTLCTTRTELAVPHFEIGDEVSDPPLKTFSSVDPEVPTSQSALQTVTYWQVLFSGAHAMRASQHPERVSSSANLEEEPAVLSQATRPRSFGQLKVPERGPATV